MWHRWHWCWCRRLLRCGLARCQRLQDLSSASSSSSSSNRRRESSLSSVGVCLEIQKLHLVRHLYCIHFYDMTGTRGFIISTSGSLLCYLRNDWFFIQTFIAYFSPFKVCFVTKSSLYPFPRSHLSSYQNSIDLVSCKDHFIGQQKSIKFINVVSRSRGNKILYK